MTTGDEKYTEEIRGFLRKLKARGWGFLSCPFLDNEVVAVLRDKPPLHDFERAEMGRAAKRIKEKRGITDGIPCYTMSEFEILLDDPSPKLLHTAKKQGATIATKEAHNG